MKFQVPAHLSRFSLLSDGGASIGFVTTELGKEDFEIIQDQFKEFGWVMFQPNKFNETDIPKDDAPDEEKSPAQRLRAVMYRVWEQEKQGDFNPFYRREMEKIINHYKKKLDI